jgi:saccharopine dehydrogenase-like NADP-dependent oxidoreductase
MKKVVVLGAGMVGSVIAVDLSSSYKVTAVDLDPGRLDKLSPYTSIEKLQADISDKEKLSEIIKDCDLVIGAVPGFMGFQILQNVIRAGKDIVDISFFSEDPFKLDKLAKNNNVTSIVDCGVAPGMSSIILGYHSTKMEIEYFKCMVGGLPFKRTWPYEYKAPFSPVDVIEEYVRPARYVEDGLIKIKEALSDPEFVDIEEVGTLEAFNTDGLRTLLQTMQIPNMIEKTLRYPRHTEYIRVLKESGFFSKECIDVNGVKVRPVDVAAKLLIPLWQLNEDEREFTAMRIHIKGGEEDKIKEYNYKMFDRFDERTKFSSMARTTGYTCTAVANLVLEKIFNKKGICPPEYVGKEKGCFDRVRSYLEERNVIYHCEVRLSEA